VGGDWGSLTRLQAVLFPGKTVGFAVDLQYVGPWCQVPDRDGHAGLEDSVPAFPAQEVKDAPGCLRFQLQEKLVLGWIRKNGGRVGMMVFVDAGRAFQGVVVELEHFLTAKDPIVIKGFYAIFSG
jgi:hypothetical protein